MTRIGTTLPARPFAGVVAALLMIALALGAGSPGAQAHHRPNLDVKWEPGGELVALLSPVYYPTNTPKVIGCAGTAFLTFSGGQTATLPGVALGPDACEPDHPPCIPYEGLEPDVTCTASGTFCCQRIVSPDEVAVGLGQIKMYCLKAFWVYWDADGNHTTPGPGSDGYEFRLGPFPGLSPYDAGAQAC